MIDCGCFRFVRFTFLNHSTRSFLSLLGQVLAGDGIPGVHKFLAIPVPIPNTVVKQELPMILR